MLSDGFETPAPAPITRFSPTLANHLAECLLRVGFERDPTYSSWNRSSPQRELGTAAHATLEFAMKSHGRGDESSESNLNYLKEQWKFQVDRAVDKLSQQWKPATIPDPEDWIGFHLTQARTIRRALRLLNRPKSPGIPTTDHVVGVEIQLEDVQSGLYGRVDRIEHKDGGFRIVDLKTGLGQGEPTPSQLRQLYLYAVLAQRNNDEWPKELVIELTNGIQFPFEVEPAEAEKILDETLTDIERFNEALVDGTLVEFAHTDGESCRWCAYKPVCGPYWTRLVTNWGHQSIKGMVLAPRPNSNPDTVIVEADSPVDIVGQRVTISGLAHQEEPFSQLAVTGFVGAISTGAVIANWSTVARYW